MNVFKKIWNWIKGAAKSVFYSIVCPALSSATTKILENKELQQLALEAVTAVADLDLDNDSKRREACARFVAAARKAGHDALKESVVNVMVELAYTVYKSIKSGQD